MKQHIVGEYRTRLERSQLARSDPTRFCQLTGGVFIDLGEFGEALPSVRPRYRSSIRKLPEAKGVRPHGARCPLRRRGPVPSSQNPNSATNNSPFLLMSKQSLSRRFASMFRV